MPGNETDNNKNILHPAGRPPVTECFLRRPVVDHKLQNAFKKPLTTVIAGAGFGKTQAVLSALKGTECSMAWMQLSVLDNHPARFWERIADTLKSQSHKLYDSLMSLGYPESIAPFDQFLKLLSRELPQKKPFILVLDDFHLIHNKTILNFIELFISAHVKNFSMVLISRKRPDISLSGMLSKGLLARITEDDLRFSKDDMTAYLHMQGLDLDQRVISDIYSYTDGWIFAIYLVGLTAQKGYIKNPVFPAKIDIFDLIEKEIFATVPKALQDFLIKISVLDVMYPELLNELAGHDLSMISEMLQMSMFIRYDSYSNSYRIHHLFMEFLSEKRARLTEFDLSQTHLAAAEWYSNNNHRAEAMYHYKIIGHYNEIFDLIISIPGRVLYEAAEELVKLIENAPEDFIRERPIIRVVKAGYMFNNNRLDEAKQELSQLREEFEAKPKTKENQAVLGEVYLLSAVICIVYSDYAFEPLFEMAYDRLPGGSQLLDYRTGMADGINACSIKDPSAGELKRYQDALFRAAPYASKAMNGCCYGLEYLNAAESSLYTGDLRAAEKYSFEAKYRSRQYMQYDIEYMANFVLVRIYTAKGNYEKATGLLSKMEKQLENLQHSDCISLYAVISGWFYLKLGKTDKIDSWIKHEEEARKKLAPVVIGREYLVRTDCMMVEERYYEILAFMEQTDKIYEQRGILYAVIQNKITKAIVHHYMGNQEASVYNLNEAYKLSNPNGLIMQYIEYGNRMRTLIHAARQNGNCTIPGEFLNRIYTKSSSYAKMLSQIVSAYEAAHTVAKSQINLSKRESEVLMYLNRGMTRKEIAANCYVSLSTVNSILKSIYDKLGATNAADAVRIAKEKNIT